MKPFVFRKVLQGVGLLVLAFLLLRVVGPWLVDLHNTAALALAAALLVGGGALVAWFAWDFANSVRKRIDRDA